MEGLWLHLEAAATSLKLVAVYSGYGKEVSRNWKDSD